MMTTWRPPLSDSMSFEISEDSAAMEEQLIAIVYCKPVLRTALRHGERTSKKGTCSEDKNILNMDH